MNTLLAILKVTDARRDVILTGGLNHRFPWRLLPPRPLAATNLYYYLSLKNVASPTYQLTVFFLLYEPFNKLKRYSSKVCVQNILNT